MNGTSGFQEVRSPISRLSTNIRLLHEHPDKFRTGSRHLLRVHDPIARSTKRSNVTDNIFRTSKLLRSAATAKLLGYAPAETQNTRKPFCNGSKHSESVISNHLGREVKGAAIPIKPGGHR